MVEAPTEDECADVCARLVGVVERELSLGRADAAPIRVR